MRFVKISLTHITNCIRMEDVLNFLEVEIMCPFWFHVGKLANKDTISSSIDITIFFIIFYGSVGRYTIHAT